MTTLNYQSVISRLQEMGDEPDADHSRADELVLNWLADSPLEIDRAIARAYRALVERSRYWATS